MPICPSGFSLRILIAYVAEKLEHACLADEDGVDGREFSLMDGLDDDDGDRGSVTAALSLPGEKKRRMRVKQVRALERSFESENKLGPERKLRMALELGLQPRQVSVWFQKFHARLSYEALRLEYDLLHRDNESFWLTRVADSIIEELEAKLAGEETLSFSSVKEEPVVSEAETKAAAGEEVES
ncbi:unnamed protein product [Musa acuminata var. zebrina]